MMSDTAEVLKKLALQVRNASSAGENTAERVGRVLMGLLELLDNDNEELKKLFLSKTGPEQTDFLLKLLGGAEIRSGLTVDSLIAEELAKLKKGLSVTGGADIDYLRVLETISAKLVDAVQVNVTNVTASEQITTLNLLVQALAKTYDLNVSHVATMMRTIIKDYVSSEAFTPGLLGEGFKISKALNGDWNLEVDNIVVRKVMTIFELVISKVRSVNGGLVISPANGRIKSVAETTGSPAYYVIGIEGDMQFVVDDYVRCQVFNGGQAKFYWVRVSSISNNSILVLKSEFTNGAVPAVGDDLVQMGNATNKARQGLIYLTASEDGKPRISVMDGVNSTSTVGKNKVILGCLDGITDTDFPADFQPSGYGLYAMNVFLKGIFVLRSGKTVESELTTTNAAVTSAKQIADAAKELANSANALLSDIASDNKLTPSEKQATKKEWEQIVSEKVKNDASADKYGVSKVACTTAYNALSVYITPLLASLTTTSDIVGTTFRSTFKAYYDARADLLNSISAKAKELADAAQGKATEAANAAATAQAKANQANTAAGAAQSTADGAVANAATANSLLSDIANDNKFTATEKQQTKKEWDVIVSEKPLNNASAVKFYVSTAAYDTAYNALNTYITPLLASLSTTSNIVGSTFRSTFKAYYDARTNLLNAVSEKAKRLADDAQNAANAAQAKADTVTRLFQEFTVAGGLFESKITEVKEYADGKVNALQVGGRNLVIGSTETDRLPKYGATATVSKLPDNNISKYKTVFSNIVRTAGDYVFFIPYANNPDIFSQSMTGVESMISFFVRTNSPQEIFAERMASVKISIDSNWRKVTFPYRHTGTGNLHFFLSGADLQWMEIHSFKIEKGNKATDWTPAPEDVAADTEAARLAAVAAQNKANEAATDAATAQTTANNAASTANAAKSRLDNWSADGSISPTEKLTLKQEQKALLDEKTQIVADAAKYAVSSTAYVTAYTNYNGELTYHTDTTPEVIAIRANFATYQAAYYTAKQTILNAISVAAKKYAEDKANDAKQAAINDAASKYPTKTEFSTSITQLSNSISLKASQTEVTGLGTRVTAAEAKITPDAIRLTVKSQTDTIAQDAAKNAVDGLQMGGTNLLKNSSNWRTAGWNGGIANNGGGYTVDNTVLYHGNPTLKTDVGSGLLHSWLKIESGVEYTYSAMVLCESYIPNNANIPLHYHAGKDNTNQGKINVTKSDTELHSGVWKLIHIVFKLTGDADSFRPFLYRGVNSGTFFWVAYMKLERGNKPTDWTPAPEDVQFQITESKAQIQVLSDQIKSTVSKETFNALGDRVGLAEANILQQADQISSKVSTIEFDKLGVRVSSAESEIKQQANKISLMVKKDDLTITGIDITNRKIVLTADSTVFKNNAGQQIAMFENNKLKVDLIDARAIVTGALVSEVISATNITTGKLTVTDGAVIGGFSVVKEGLNYSLINNNLTAKIVIQSGNDKYLRIGGRENTLISMRIDGANDGLANNGIFIQSYGSGNKCIELIANAGSEYAIKSHGPHLFGQRNGEKWNAPGVLWAARIGQWGSVENSWGNGCTASSKRTSDGNYTISHDLGHNQYYVIIQCTPYATDGWRYMIGMVGGKYPTSFDVALVDTGEGHKNCAFEVFIVGRNKW